MTWTSSGSPAIARRSQSRQAPASSVYPARTNASSVSVASRSQQNRESQFRTPPTSPGSDVVGAATIPPVGAYVSALSVISERRTASSHGGTPEQRLDHSSQNETGPSSAAPASNGSRGCSCDGDHVRTNGTRSP